METVARRAAVCGSKVCFVTVAAILASKVQRRFCLLVCVRFPTTTEIGNIFSSATLT